MHATPATRRYDIDALRVFAFGLLILYHVGMFYVAPVSDWGWHIKSHYLAQWLEFPMLAVNRWRMLLVFLVSGLAVHFLRRRQMSLGVFLRARTFRLLVPLLFGMAVIIPIQPYCQHVTTGAIEPGFGKFLLRYWFHSGNPFGGPYGWTWTHLWYLIYLWCYTVVLAALLPFLESSGGRALRSRLSELRGFSLLALPALPFMAAAFLLQDRFPETHALVHDWFMHTIYFTAFVYGYLIGTETKLWEELTRLRWASLGGAVLFFSLYLTAVHLIPEGTKGWPIAGIRVMRWCYTWLALATILGWAHHALNRPFRWLPYANGAVYPWYVFHQSLIILLGFALTPLALGPVLEPALVLGGTIAGCAVLHHFVVRRIGPPGALFGYKWSAKAPAAPGNGFVPATE